MAHLFSKRGLGSLPLFGVSVSLPLVHLLFFLHSQQLIYSVLLGSLTLLPARKGKAIDKFIHCLLLQLALLYLRSKGAM